MKRSSCVPLLVLGSMLPLGGCDSGAAMPLTQQRYLARDDCVRDWGDDSLCNSNGAGGGSGYVGPRYYWDRDAGRPVVVSPDGKESVATRSRLGPSGSSIGESFHAGSISRGGFGSFARGFSLGG
ncbi:MAG TPA: hypothetical protein VMB75_05175 [Rhodocyclaceae bacterium]|nr:hypothetical protein [Rhodocyclaceae bacterium]